MLSFSKSFSATAAVGARRMMATVSHKPLKTIYGIHGRYATAVYCAASKAGVLEQVETELTAITEVVKKSAGLSTFLSNPTVPRQEKQNRLSQLLDESKFTNITRNLFLVLAGNGRAGESMKVAAAYHELIQAYRGAVNVTVISAEALKKEQVKTIQAAILKTVGEGKTVEVKLQVEPSILGGLQILIDDRFLDLSVATRVNALTKTLESATV